MTHETTQGVQQLDVEEVGGDELAIRQTLREPRVGWSPEQPSNDS